MYLEIALLKGNKYAIVICFNEVFLVIVYFVKRDFQFISSLPLMLRCAVQNGVRIRSYASFHLSMMKLKKKIRAEKKVDHAPVKGPQVSASSLMQPVLTLKADETFLWREGCVIF